MDKWKMPSRSNWQSSITNYLFKEYLLSTIMLFGMALDAAMDKTKCLPYNALWCIPKGDK